MALPTASTPGYTTFRGKVSCVCLAEWLPVYERLLLFKGLIKSNIDLWQLTGGAAASGGTHTQGGAFDLLYQTSAQHVAVAREMGAPGTWGRTVSQGFAKDHLHGVLHGCPHNGPAAYQLEAQRRGYNGLGKSASGPYKGMWGYGAKDEYPPPTTYRTWKQGIAWANAQMAPPPIAKPATEVDMGINLTDVIPGSNPQITVGQALQRGAWAYAQIISGGSVDKRINAAAAELSALRTALAKGDTADAQAILDRIEVSLTVKPEELKP